MKHMKKIITLLLAAVMVLAMSSVAFAGDAATGKTITLTGGKAGHTYTLYQIFTGKVETKDGKKELTNIQWGSGANNTFRGAYSTAASAAKEIAGKNDARATAQELVAKSYLGTGTANELTADGNVSFTGLDEGYYVIVDSITGTVAEEGDYSSAYIVKVVENVEGAVKGSGVTSDKEVIDKETNAASTTDAAAYNIGDAVPFKLNATTADNAAAYRQYHITFQDKLSAGLTAPESYTVTVLGKTFTVPASGADPAAQETENGTVITVTKVTPATGNTFAINVEFTQKTPTKDAQDNITSYLNAEVNSKPIVVSYSATLNQNAVIGLPGNDNEFYVNYSNNPEDADGGDEGKTPEDKVKVFTYKTVIDKVDADGNALEGAMFTIYQEVAQGTSGAVKGSELTWNEGVEHSKISADKYYLRKQMTTVSGNNAQFEFEGLADGTYVLVETVIPDGFNAFQSVEFTIDSSVDETAGITELTGTTPFTTTNPGEDGAVKADKKDKTKHELDSGELFAEIENNSGAVLPGTGGIGTVIFYVLGSLLVVGCGIILVSRRRMNANK